MKFFLIYLQPDPNKTVYSGHTTKRPFVRLRLRLQNLHLRDIDVFSYFSLINTGFTFVKAEHNFFYFILYYGHLLAGTAYGSPQLVCNRIRVIVSRFPEKNFVRSASISHIRLRSPTTLNQQLLSLCKFFLFSFLNQEALGDARKRLFNIRHSGARTEMTENIYARNSLVCLLLENNFFFIAYALFIVQHFL